MNNDDVTVSEVDLQIVDGWQGVYDFLYEGAWGDDVGEDFTGWNSVYDGAAISINQMHEWRAATVERVLSLNPRTVLEIGVGDGHILCRVAPRCERYVGTDFSAVGIESFRAQLQGHPELAGKVELHAFPAHALDPLPLESFDTVIINSVVQYFPGLDYLSSVLTAALARLAPGGALYLGDVRNERSHRCLTTAVRLHRARADLPAAELLAEVDEAVADERELLVDPDYFATFAKGHGSVGAVDVRLRRGRAHNELTRHRYDAVLHKQPTDVLSLAESPRHPWCGDLEAVTRHLMSTRPAHMRLVGVPNGRLTTELAAMHDLRAQDDCADAVRRLGSRVPAGVPDPEDFYRVGAETGYAVAVTWSADREGEVDVLLVSSEAASSTGVWTGVYRSGPTDNTAASAFGHPPELDAPVSSRSSDATR